VSVSQSAGCGQATLILSADVNPMAAARSAVVTVSAPGLTSKTVTVTQAAATATLAVSSNALNIGYAAGSTATFTVTSNADWSIDTGQSWLSANPSAGTGNGMVVLTAQANMEPGNRNATVTVSATGVAAQVITVTQSFNTVLETQALTKIRIYPNPFTGIIHIKGITGKATFSLTDAVGRLIISRELYGDGYVVTSGLPAGMYIVSITTPWAHLERKLVRQ